MINDEETALQRAIEASLEECIIPTTSQPRPIPQSQAKPRSTPFSTSQIQIHDTFRVYPIINPKHKFTGKIILPQYPFRNDLQAGKAFGTPECPIIFKLTSKEKSTTLYLGLQEFHHDDARMVFLPYWAIQQLGLETGQRVYIENLSPKSLPKAKLIKVQPLTSDFVTKVEDPRQVIEDFFNQHMIAIAKEQQITIPYQDQEYELYIKELLGQPDGQAVPVADLTNTDVNLEFDAPLDEESRQIEEEHQTELETEKAIIEAKQLLKDTTQTLSQDEQMAAIRALRAAKYAQSLHQTTNE